MPRLRTVSRITLLAVWMVLACQSDDETVPMVPSAPVDPPAAEIVPSDTDKQIDPPETPIVRGGAGFDLVTVAAGLNQGTGFTFAGNRIYIVEKRGVVRVVSDGQLLDKPFLDLSSETNSAQDRGLLGVAVHPRFPELPYLYLVHVYDPPEVFSSVPDAANNGAADGNGARASRLLRVEADPATNYTTARAGTLTVLVGTNSTPENIGMLAVRNGYDPPACGSHGAYVRDCLPSDENSHTIGTVKFGPDGMLYMGHGDGCDFGVARPGACTRAVDLDSLAGKILRIDPISGQGLPDNPYFDGDPDSNRSKVYQLGLRNPFRFSFDAETQALYVGDVGWNVWEEINRGPAGANFGWPCYEGGNGNNLEQPAYIDSPACSELKNSGTPITAPLFGYAHQGMQGNSVLVGDVYRGALYPPLYHGALFYTDFNNRELRFLKFDRRGNVASSQLVVGPVGYLTQISAEPSSGDLYLMRIGTSPQEPTSTLVHLVFRGYGAGPAPGVYTLKSKAKDACVQTIDNHIETRPCVDQPAQHFRLDLLEGDAYRVRPEGSELAWTTILRAMWRGDLTLDPLADYASQTFRAYPLRGGFQLIDIASELCITALSEEPSEAVGVLRCADVDAQLFELTSTTNQPPVLIAIADQAGTLGDAVQLQLAANDPEGLDVTYFATGLPDSLSIDPQRGLLMGELTKPGTYRVTIRVNDGKLDATSEFTWTVKDNQLPDAVIDTPIEGFHFTVGQVIEYSGHATDAAGVAILPYNLSWELYAHHNQHIHFGALPPDTIGDSGRFLGEDHGDNTAYELCLNARDDRARVGRTCRILRPNEVEYTLDTEPSGLSVTWEGVPRDTPFTVQTHVSGVRTLVAPPQQPGYAFVAWSDHGAATHDITIDSVPRRLVATYKPAP